MRRSRPLPIETTAAISFVVVASIVALVVLVRHSDVAETVQAADRSALTTVDDEAPAVDQTTTTTTSASSPTTEAPSATTSTTSSTTTTEVPAADPPAPVVSTVESPPACPGLVSETYWTRTGVQSVLVAAAGGAARYVEVVTNESDEACTLSTNRCGTTAELRTSTGEPTDSPSLACSAELREEVLEPGAARTEQLTISFPVPPGEYYAHIRRYDGTAVDLPVRLDDRLPECATDALELRVNGEQHFRQRSEVRESGFRVDLILGGAAESCTVRTLESHLRLQPSGEQAEAEPVTVVDETQRWLADPSEIGIFTHMVVPPTEIPAGEYDGLVTLVLASGDELSAPLELLVR